MTQQQPTRCATVALLGEPNAGKSTFINAVLGERIAAVHRKPQMTRKNLLGLHTENHCQIIFIDTPGAHEPQEALNQGMMAHLNSAIDEADIVLVLLEIHRPLPQAVMQRLENLPAEKAVIYALNKCDLPPEQWLQKPEAFRPRRPGQIFLISAREKIGLSPLIQHLQSLAPEHPFIHPEDDLTTASMRQIAADVILEKIMNHLHKEIPYQSAVKIEEYREAEKRHHVKALIVVNRDSQKGMVIGKGGATLEKIRKESERDLKALAGCSVRLSLFVKVDPDWIRQEGKVKGYL